jgi:hypothetical protein
MVKSPRGAPIIRIREGFPREPAGIGERLPYTVYRHSPRKTEVTAAKIVDKSLTEEIT